MITSLNNGRIKHLKELQDKKRTRSKEGLFIAEGFKMFVEAPVRLIREIYIDIDVYNRIKESRKEAPLSNNENLIIENGLLNKADEKLKECESAHIFIETLSTEVFNKASATETPQGIILVLEQPSYKVSDILGKNILILEDIQDPGNLGTMVRTGEGAGISGILMTKGCVDIFNPKTVRSTMGSLYRVPFVYSDDLKNDIDVIKQAGVKVYAAHLKGTLFYDEIEYSGNSAFLIGNEGNGLSDEVSKLADEYLKIPMEGELESLNAAISAAILMYQAR